MRYVGRLLIHRLALLIIDEAHQVVVAGTPKTMRDLAAHGDRSMRLESLVSRILVLKPNIARIALTRLPAAQRHLYRDGLRMMKPLIR